MSFLSTFSRSSFGSSDEKVRPSWAKDHIIVLESRWLPFSKKVLCSLSSEMITTSQAVLRSASL